MVIGVFGGRANELRDTIDEAREKRDRLQQTADIAFKEAALDVLRELHQDLKVLNDLFDTIDLVVAPAIKGIQAEQAKIKEDQDWNELERSFKDQQQWFGTGNVAHLEVPT